MSDPPASPEPPLQPRYTVLAMIMMAMGIVPLLPGACALLFVPAAFSPYGGAILPLVLVCFFISAGGGWLIYVARQEALQAARDEASGRDGAS